VVDEFHKVVAFIFEKAFRAVLLLMVHRMRLVFFAALAATLICSCESESPEIGSDFFSDGAMDFSYIDTATIKLSTIQFEKLQTGNSTRLLVGSYNDEKLGKVTAVPYFQLTPSETIDLQEENVTYDYISLILPYDTYSYYDTTTLMRLNVFKVTEEMETDEGYLYNTTKFNTELEPLGSLEFRPRPHQDSIEIRLSDVLGQEIFLKAKEGSDDLSSANFLEYLPGLAVVPDTTQSSCIIGLGTNAKIKLYYLDKDEIPVTQKSSSFEVTASSTNLFHTHTLTNRRSTKLKDALEPKERLSSSLTDDQAYIQAGSGLALRIDIPYLRELKQLENFYVTQAILEIYPIRKSSSERMPLPNQLKVFKADKRNEIYTEIETLIDLIEDVDLDRSTRYAMDVTEFVKEQMALQILNENALLFTTPSDTYPVSAERVYIGAPSYEYKTNLRIYFATVNY
jgi:hypothetical protein